MRSAFPFFGEMQNSLAMRAFSCLVSCAVAGMCLLVQILFMCVDCSVLFYLLRQNLKMVEHRNFVMRLRLVVVLLILVVAYGCVSSPKNQVLQNSSTMVAEPTFGPAINPAASALFQKSSSITSMHYIYYGPPNDALGYEVYVGWNRSKVVLPKQVQFSDGLYFDTIYLDKRLGVAVAYCESDSCPKVASKGPFRVDYSSYDFKTPFDFLGLVEVKIKGDELFENRRVSVIDFIDRSGISGTMLVDKSVGVPLKVVSNGTIYEFRNTYFNSGILSDVSRQS